MLTKFSRTLKLATFASATALTTAGLFFACGGEVSPPAPAIDAAIDRGNGGVANPGRDGSTRDANEMPTADGGDGGADGNVPVVYTIESFAQALGVEVCHSIARCCYGNPDPPDGSVEGGTFDVETCRSESASGGFESSNTGYEVAADAGHLTLNQQAANECIALVSALPCNLSGPDLVAARTACSTAFRGAVAVGGDCIKDIECQTGTFCKPRIEGGEVVVVDGGTSSTCAAVGAVGDDCSLGLTDAGANYLLAETSCSGGERVIGGQYCSYWTFNNTPPNYGVYLPFDQWKCTPPQGAGNKCWSSNWCSNTLCDYSINPNICTPAANYFDEKKSCTGPSSFFRRSP